MIVPVEMPLFGDWLDCVHCSSSLQTIISLFVLTTLMLLITHEGYLHLSYTVMLHSTYVLQ